MRHTLLTVATILIAGPSVTSAEIIDRILAVVENQIITLSDARAALTFKLVPPEVSQDPIGAALQRLIDRRLTLGEVERYAPAEPAQSAVDTRVAAIAAQFKDALAFETALNQSAMAREDLRRFVRDTLRIETYLRQRFASGLPPSDDDLVRYHREHSEDFQVDGRPRPFEDVREIVRARLADEQRAAFVRQWIEGLRRRANVLVLYVPGTAR